MQVGNYIDIIPPVFLIIIIAIDTITHNSGIKMEGSFNSFFRTVQSINTFFIWFKMIFFMRIFSGTAYLIRMIIQVIIDMKAFMLIFFISIIAFGDAMLAVAMGNGENKDKDGKPLQFISNFFASFGYAY